MSTGAAPHAERKPFADGTISDSEAQMLAKRLTRRKQEVELLEDEIDDLEAEVERLQETLDWVRGRVDRAADLVLDTYDDEEVIEDLYADIEDHIDDALDRVEGGQS